MSRLDEPQTNETLDVLALYDAYHKQILRYVLNRTGDVEAARDITAEVFFKAYRGRWRYRVTSAPASLSRRSGYHSSRSSKSGAANIIAFL